MNDGLDRDRLKEALSRLAEIAPVGMPDDELWEVLGATIAEVENEGLAQREWEIHDMMTTWLLIRLCRRLGSVVAIYHHQWVVDFRKPEGPIGQRLAILRERIEGMT